MTQGALHTQPPLAGSTASGSGWHNYRRLAVDLAPALIPVALSGLVGLAYGLLRGGYGQFYGRYGVSPDDVGLSQQDALLGLLRFCMAQRLPIIGPLKVLAALVVFALLWAGIVLYCKERRWFERRVTPRRALLAVTSYVVLLLVILVVSSYVVLPNDREFASRRIDNARSVHAKDLAFLVIEADVASVAWVGSGPPPAGFPPPTKELIFLGHNDAVAVLYDPASRTTWRIPESLGLVTVRVPA